MKQLLCFTLSLTVFALSAKEPPKYPVSDIPALLKEKVNVVVREDQMRFNILSRSKANMHVYQAITILNPNGKRFATEIVHYDKLSKITSIRGSIYDANGILLKKLKPSEIYDQSAFDGYSLYSDNRLKAIDLSHGSYPYTVEFEYEIEYKYLFQIPTFTVVPDENVSIQRSSYTLTYPKDLKPRYLPVNVNVAPNTADLGSNIESVAWRFENIGPLQIEPMGPSMEEIIPHILAAPVAFEYDGYSGSMETWDEFGQWISNLNKGRNVLPEGTRQKVQSLTQNLTSPEEKIRALYEYMQNKTRYVSIQLGIGGFQPFEASIVDQTGYGDCKALSNYMVSMLDIIGIKAHYVLIRAGISVSPLKSKFPSAQFNHAVVCIPQAQDTVWLECTSQTNPFGYMGRFTGDRKALAITDAGAQIVRTPIYSEEQNLQSRIAIVSLDAAGNAKASVKTHYSGLQYESDGLDDVLSDQYDDQIKWVRKTTQIPAFDINSFTMANKKARVPAAVVNLDLTLNRLATVTGKRIFLTPNLMNRSSYMPEKVEQRKTKVVKKFGYIDIDTVVYQLPQEIYPEFVPAPVLLKSQFGEYESDFKVEQGKLVYVRRIKMLKGEFPAESYSELIDFYKSINKADNTKVVFLSKT